MREQRAAIIGRDSDVRALADSLRATGQEARVLLVTAGAGMGKTTILELARRAAAQDGAAVMWLGWEDENDEPWDGADVIAGHETTVNLLGNAIVALLDHPDQTRLLRDNSERIPDAIEEFLRYDPPLEITPTRFATEEFELGGKLIRAAETVTVALTSASRDAPVEPGADPHQLDVLRKQPRHAAFGHGIHYCIGAPLARLEGAIALRVLLSRLPDLT